MSVQKKVVIAYIVGGVGLTGGVAGLVVGLTRKPKEVVTDGHTLHIKYLNDPDATEDITTYEHMTIVPASTVKTIASLPFDDPSDSAHHTKALDKIYADVGQSQVIYDPTGTYNEVTLNDDATWYVALKQSHYHVYLHYWNNEAVYNPSDWYPTKEYDPTTLGFTQRGAPTDVTNYQFLGWQLNTLPYATATTKEECLYGVGESYREDNNGNAWPVVPDQMKINGEYVGAKTWHLHPIYKLTSTTFNFFDTNGNDKIMDSYTGTSSAGDRHIENPIKEHHEFTHWTYMEETKLIVNGVETVRTANEEVQEGDLNCEFLCPTVPLKAHWSQDQHKAVFYLNNTHTKSEEVWVDIIDEASSKAEINESDLPISTPVTTQEDYKFIGWSEKENPTSRDDIYSSWPMSIYDDAKKMYPVFLKADYTVNVNYIYEGITGIWKKEGKTDVKKEASTFGVWEDISYSVLDLTNEARLSLELDDGYQLCGDGTKPNFLGWKLTNHSELIQTTIKFTDNTTINAVYGDSNNITVTFNSSGGDFTYKDSYNETITNSIISYNLNLAEWREEHEQHVYLHDVYEAATSRIEGERDAISLTRDGYKLVAMPYSESEPDGSSGWVSYGINLPHNFEIADSVALEARWEPKTAYSWKDDDWGTIARYANLGETEFIKAYESAYKSTNNQGLNTGDDNKAANTFVGLQKEISIPTLGDGTYTVRVIGVGQDQIDNSSSKVLLTFDFIDCPLSAAVGKTNDYIQGYTNQTYAGLIKGGMTYTMRNSIKPVVKPQVLDKGAESAGTGAYTAQTFSNYIFIESAYEVNGGTETTTGGSSQIVQDSSAYVESLPTATEYKNNLFKYQWYDKKYDDATKDASNPANLDSRAVKDDGDSAGLTGATGYRCKFIGNTNTITAWQLRTPAMRAYYNPEQTSNKRGNSFYVTSDEKSSASNKPSYGGIWDYYSNIANYISPCFCLGLASI